MIPEGTFVSSDQKVNEDTLPFYLLYPEQIIEDSIYRQFCHLICVLFKINRKEEKRDKIN